MENKKENEVEINKEEIIEHESMTREINLDELYDGAVNNTVVIDPVTNDELLMETRNNNHKILGIMAAILILLVLYFINNKLDIGNDKPNVSATVTTTTTTTSPSIKKGLLKCSYVASSSSETQNASFSAEYEDTKVINSEFYYSVVLSTDKSSEITEDLKTRYETFFLNNSSINGITITFEKDDKGFSFDSKTDYSIAEFDKITTDNQTILYAVPQSSDTLDNLLDTYTNKGYSCALSSNENN